MYSAAGLIMKPSVDYWAQREESFWSYNSSWVNEDEISRSLGYAPAINSLDCINGSIIRQCRRRVSSYWFCQMLHKAACCPRHYLYTEREGRSNYHWTIDLYVCIWSAGHVNQLQRKMRIIDDDSECNHAKRINTHSSRDHRQDAGEHKREKTTTRE